MPIIGDSLANLMWTDPPYGASLGMNESVESKKRRNRRTDNKVVANDDLVDKGLYQFLMPVWAAAREACVKGAAFYICHSDGQGYWFRKSVIESGMLLKQCLIWKKQALVMGRQDYHWIHEPILYGWFDGAAHHWYGDRKQTTVLEFDRPRRSEEHPTMKPVDLIEYCLHNSSDRNHIVFDPFGGSGSTLIACEKTERKCRTIEIDPVYCDVIVKRWEDFTGKEAKLIRAR